MKIVTVVGARPQFIKAAMISRAIRDFNSRATSDERRATEVLIHTGQHYDHEMNEVFFDQLDIPTPDYHLEIGSGPHGDQTGRMLSEIEKILLKEKPDVVLVYGDTNSTLAGALSAAKLHIPVGHVEGGMRSFNRRMPEEINRVLTGHIAKWHFCPTETAVNNLKNEGISEGIHLVGDVMYDAVMLYKDVAHTKSNILCKLGLTENSGSRATGDWRPATAYALATVHRAENTDDPERLRNIIEALAEISKEIPVIFPVHPRTGKAIEHNGLNLLLTAHCSLLTTEPLPYLDLLRLEGSADVVITDSGGMQKEACWMGVPCVTLRDETEWVETVESGLNCIAGADKGVILSSVHASLSKKCRRAVVDGAIVEDIAGKIVEMLAYKLS